jgi:hypothetical protein
MEPSFPRGPFRYGARDPLLLSDDPEESGDQAAAEQPPIGEHAIYVAPEELMSEAYHSRSSRDDTAFYGDYNNPAAATAESLNLSSRA